jgi:hypothetical protein
MSLSATSLFNWNDGSLIVLSAGQTAKCENLVKGQLYAILIYNTSQTDVDAVVTVVWSNNVPPSKITVRGTTGTGSSANFVFVSGSDTDFISISLGPSSAASITACVLSTTMPLNTTGINNAALTNDGLFYPFEKYDRYYTEPSTGWRSVTIESSLNQFICLQMLESAATIVLVNFGAGLADGQVKTFGPTAGQAGTVNINNFPYQTYSVDIQGNGEAWVFMNGDSQQNSKDAQIALQQLSTFAMLLNVSGISRVSKAIGNYFKS